MYKITNMCNYSETLERFGNDYNKMRNFLNEYNFDGIELIQYEFWNEDSIPKEMIKGLHLKFYPVWIDFWREDKEKLLSKVENEENIKMLYGGLNKQVLVDYYKKELEIAEKIGVEYLVFHVCHVDIDESYSYNFSYTDEEVIKETAYFLNQVFKDTNYTFKLLLENLWWPGLKLTDKHLVKKLIDSIDYKNTGFMLDTGHLLHTNPYLKNSDEAIDYILETIENLGEMKKYIKGVHLNYSLSGEYVLETIKKYENKNLIGNFKDRYMEAYWHIFKIDYHHPFINKRVREIISKLDLDYLVYEFITNSLEELKDYIEKQDKCLKL